MGGTVWGWMEHTWIEHLLCNKVLLLARKPKGLICWALLRAFDIWSSVVLL